MVLEDLDKDKIKILGDYLQLLGDKTVSSLEEEENPSTLDLVRAHIITALGNFFQALSGYMTIREVESSSLDKLGGLLEVVGNALQIIGELIEIYQIIKEED